MILVQSPLARTNGFAFRLMRGCGIYSAANLVEFKPVIFTRIQHRLGYWRGAAMRMYVGRDKIKRRLWMAPRANLISTQGGRFRLGENVVVQSAAVIQVRKGRLEIGPDSVVGPGSMIIARDSVRIGRDALIAEHVTIRDQDHVFGGPRPTARNGFITAPISIGDNVWLGAKVTVLKGVTIGDNVVVAANSVVTRDLPSNVVAAGIPAVVIKTTGTEPVSERGAEDKAR